MIGLGILSQAIRENESFYTIEPSVSKMNPLKSRVNPLMLLKGKRGFIGIKIRVYRQCNSRYHLVITGYFYAAKNLQLGHTSALKLYNYPLVFFNYLC